MWRSRARIVDWRCAGVSAAGRSGDGGKGVQMRKIWLGLTAVALEGAVLAWLVGTQAWEWVTSGAVAW